MTSFSYSIAKFIPDLTTYEPVNVGIMAYSSEKKMVKGKFIQDYSKLSRRFPKINSKAVKNYIDTFATQYEVESEDDFVKLQENFKRNLIFIESGEVISGTMDKALTDLFKRYITIETKIKRRKFMNRLQLRAKITHGIREAKFEKEWIKPRVPIKGKIHDFVFDYGFKNGQIKDLVHALTFDGNSEIALRDAKALAISVEDAMSANEGLTCAAILHPPTNEKKEENYEASIDYLKDKDCLIRFEEDIPSHLITIKNKLAHM